jgi:hypothetical protein
VNRRDSSNPTDFRREMDPQLPLARTKFRSAARGGSVVARRARGAVAASGAVG